MATNGTCHGNSCAVPGQQQASGQSIFWAMAAIVLNAMLQPSFTGYVWSGDSFIDLLWPHRSSPFVCLVDAAADIWIIVQSVWKLDADYRNDEPAKPTAVAIRIAIFVLGVVPQAIKLFSMRGVPATQAIAAGFLFSSLVSMARTLRIDGGYHDLSRLIDRSNLDGRSFPPKVVTFVLGWAAHATGMFLTWYWISGEARIKTSGDVVSIIDWFTTIFIAVSLLYITQHTIFMLMDKKPPIPQYPVIIIILWTNLLCIPDLFVSCKTCKRWKYTHGYWRFQYTLQLLCSVALCSLFIAYTLEALAKKLLSWRNRAPASERTIPDLPMSTADLSLENRSSPAHAVENQNVFGAARTHIDQQPNEEPPIYTEYDNNSPPPQRDNLPLETRTATASDYQEALGQGSQCGPGAQLQGGTLSSALPTASSDGAHEAVQPQHGTISSPAFTTAMGNETTAASDSGQSNTAPGTGPSASEAETGKAEDLGILLKIVLQPVIYGMIVLCWAGLINFVEGKDADTAQQVAAEQRTDGSRIQAVKPVKASRPQRNPKPVVSLWRAIEPPLKFTVRWTLRLPWRLLLSVFSLYGHTFKWIQWQLGRQSLDTIMIAFGIANFATAAVYYLALFDGKGTVNPGWTSFLG